MRLNWKRGILIGMFAALFACAAAWAGAPPAVPQNTAVEQTASDDVDEFDELDAEIEEGGMVADPLRPLNRVFFEVNDKLYFWALKPVAQGYRAVVPEPARRSVGNFFTNLTSPVRFVNQVLQGKAEAAGIEFTSFLVNSTVGVLGLWDPAEKLVGKKKDAEDLGQTLGHYGMGNGFYVVWPLLGPSTLRDSVGLAGDHFLDPVNWLEHWEMRTALSGLDTVNKTSFRIGDYEDLKEAAIVPYEAFRDAYIQNRKKRVAE